MKKWGLAPSVGTLAPPPAYGSERGSVTLEAGAGVSPPSVESSHSVSSRRLHRGPGDDRDRAIFQQSTFPFTRPPTIATYTLPPSLEGTSSNGHHPPN